MSCLCDIVEGFRLLVLQDLRGAAPGHPLLGPGLLPAMSSLGLLSSLPTSHVSILLPKGLCFSGVKVSKVTEHEHEPQAGILMF